MINFKRTCIIIFCLVLLLSFFSHDVFAICTTDDDCDDGVWCNGVELCSPSAPGVNEEGCLPGPGDPCAHLEDYVCNEDGDNCVFTECDQDNDGHDRMDHPECGGDDCDDLDGDTFPGLPETCDEDNPQHDEDCNPFTISGVRPARGLGYYFELGSFHGDADNDGWNNAECCNYSSYHGKLLCGLDCDDSNPSIHPLAREVCNGIDDNCNGLVDEGVKILMYFDNDGDGFGDKNESSLECPGTPGFSVLETDCDDDNPAIIPGAMICNNELSGVLVCQDGQYTMHPCDTDNKEICVNQPNGTGFCITKKIK